MRTKPSGETPASQPAGTGPDVAQRRLPRALAPSRNGQGRATLDLFPLCKHKGSRIQDLSMGNSLARNSQVHLVHYQVFLLLVSLRCNNIRSKNIPNTSKGHVEKLLSSSQPSPMLRNQSYNAEAQAADRQCCTRSSWEAPHFISQLP